MQAAGQRWLVPRLRNRGDVGRERHGQDDLHQNVGWSPPVRRRGEGPQARREIQVYILYICINRICTEYKYNMYRVYIEYIYTEYM